MFKYITTIEIKHTKRLNDQESDSLEKHIKTWLAKKHIKLKNEEDLMIYY